MDFVPGSKLEGLRAEGSKSYKLSDEQLHNIGRLLAFQIFMGGEDMLPVPYASNPMKPYNAGNVIVSTDPGSSKVSMIDVTPGDYKKDKPIHPEVLKGVKKLVKSQSGGPLTEAVRKMLAHSTGTSHDVGEAGREKIREGFIESMRIITEFDVEQF
jgi:hypothetical protein